MFISISTLTVVLAAGPATVSLAATGTGPEDAPRLDRLLADARADLETAGLFHAAPSADVEIQPSIVALATGKERIVLTLRSRVVPSLVDRLAFEVTPGKLGPTGTEKMLRAALERAEALNARALAQPVTAPPTSAEPAMAGTAPAAGEPQMSAPLEESNAPAAPFDFGRLRFGASAGAGTFLPGPMFSLGVEARVGWQFTQWFGSYLEVGATDAFMISGKIDASGVQANVGAASWYYAALMAELMGADTVFIAAGPGIAKGSWAFVSQSAGADGSMQNVQVNDGWMPALDVKVGVGLGKSNPETGRRHQFTLALELMTVIATHTVAAGQTAGTMGASQSAQVGGGAAVGFAPMLMLGYDGR